MKILNRNEFIKKLSKKDICLEKEIRFVKIHKNEKGISFYFEYRDEVRKVFDTDFFSDMKEAHKEYLKYIKNQYQQINLNKDVVKIYNWRQLAKLKNKRNGWKLKVNLKYGSAQLEDNKENGEGYHYLTTHTFYTKANADHASFLLRKAGWNVKLMPYED